MTGNPDTLAAVKHYYGEVLQSSSDLQTSACCLADAMPAHLIPLLKDAMCTCCHAWWVRPAGSSGST